MYSHGITFGGHPVMCAIALKNIEIMKREGIVEHVREHEGVFRAKLETLLDLPIVGDVRGAGFFYALELVKDKETQQTFDDDECETLLRGYLSRRAVRRRASSAAPTTAATRSSRSRRRSSPARPRWTRSSASSATCSPRPAAASVSDTSVGARWFAGVGCRVNRTHRLTLRL